MAVIVASGCLLSAIAARHDVRRGSLADSSWLANPVKAYGFACGPSVLAFGLSFVLPWAAVVCLVADTVLALLSQALYRPQSAPLDTVEAVVPAQAQPIELMKDATA